MATKSAKKKVYVVGDKKIKTTSLAKAQELAAKEKTIEQKSATKKAAPLGYTDAVPTFEGANGPVPIRNYEQENPYGYGGTKKNQFPGVKAPPPVTKETAASITKQYNLGGILNEKELIGLSLGDAQAKARAMRDSRVGSTSALTSFNFNPQTLTGAKKTLEGFNMRLQDTNSDPWTSKGTKKDKLQGLYESTANEFARLFSSRDEFESLLAHDTDFAANMKAFQRAGGDLNSIRSRISGPMTMPPDEGASQRAAIAGLMRQGVTDPKEIADAMNEAGRASGVDSGFTPQEVMALMQPPAPKVQSTADYLAGLSVTPPPGTKAETDAFNSLIPERQLAQEQIMRIASVPAQYRDLYFGTPEAIGILEEKRIQAEEQKKIIEKQEKADERNARAAANRAIAKNNADLAIEQAQIEENRLAAKNYATGALAKLGALKTTGAAPVKLAMLEQKYQQQSQQLRTAVRYANQGIELKLKEAVSKIEIDTDQSILDLQADLTKDKEEVFKEIQKLEQDAWNKIYTITDKAAGELRTQREKYTKEATALAEKNAKAYAKAAAAYNAKGISGKLGGKKTGTEAERKAAVIADYEEAFTPGQRLDDGTPTVDQNGFITVTAWKEAIKEAPSMGLTRSEFVKNFGYMLFPDEDGLPSKAYGLTANERKVLE